MSYQERFRITARNSVEVVTPEELKATLSRGNGLRAYVGVEPSGLLHLGTGPILAEKLSDFCEAGFHVTVLLADWHAYINDKLGSDWERIKACAEYMVEAYQSLGVPKEVRYLYASELVADSDYWKSVIQASKASSVSRIKRAMSIMGRQEEEGELDASKLIYPAMQVTDIHILDLDLALGGMDQRRAHMLYRDLVPKLGWKQLVAIHTPMLSSLQGGGRMDSWDLKMSTSKPETCIFIHDSPGVIQEKVRKAYCPPRDVEGNPILQFCQYLLLPRFSRVRVERSPRHGGDIVFEDYSTLERAYREGELHPQDLKAAVAGYLAELLEDSRKHFEARSETLKRVERALGIRG
ncbi:MAG: tyrosine--tRNA ligase [Thermoplasmata archaeon]